LTESKYDVPDGAEEQVAVLAETFLEIGEENDVVPPVFVYALLYAAAAMVVLEFPPAVRPGITDKLKELLGHAVEEITSNEEMPSTRTH
jgi:hypothetical protein